MVATNTNVRKVKLLGYTWSPSYVMPLNQNKGLLQSDLAQMLLQAILNKLLTQILWLQ